MHKKTSFGNIFSHWNWVVWIQWVVLTTLAWIAAFWALNKIHDVLFNLLTQLSTVSGKSLAMAPVGLLFGITISFPQSFLLRKKLAIPRGWTRANALACAIIWALPWSMDPILHKITVGAVVGFAQWLVLRRKFPGHSWWILAGGISWNVAEFVSQWLQQQRALSMFPGNKELFGAGINGALYGLLTGLGLCYLLYYTLFVGKRARLRNISPPRKEIFAVSWIVMHGIAWAIGYGQLGQRLQQYLTSGTGLPAHVILEKTILECLAALCICLVLWRQHFRNTLWWVIWNGIGAAAGIFAWTVPGLENASGIVVYGAIVGFFQWFVLSQKFRYFLLWMPLRTLAWAGSLILAAQIGGRMTIDVGWGVGGLVYGAITGGFLYWQLR
ncbi:MAG: hypothetical protein GY801_31720 [bacterium]|nr:hypothetical protein [bacterium]